MMKTRLTDNTFTFLTLLLLIAIGFFIVSHFTPLHTDDYNYHFINSPEEIRNVNPWPGFMSFYTDNFAGVARIVPHMFVALFSDITGKGIFNIFSTVGFILLCYLLAAVATPDKRLRLPVTLLAATLIWFAIPGVFEACLWMAGACNYLFVAIIILAFYRSITSDSPCVNPLWSLPLWFAFGFLTGWTNEGFTTGLSAGCALHYIVLRRDKLNARRIAMLSGLLAGTMLICLTPFNLYRFIIGHSGDFSLHASLMSIFTSLSSMTNIRIAFLLVIMAVLLKVSRHVTKTETRDFIKKHSIIITAWVVSFAFIVMAGHTTGHSRFPTEFFALILLLSVICRFLSARAVKISSLSGGIAMAISFIAVIPHTKTNFDSFEDMRRQIIAGDTIITSDNIYGNSYTSRYSSTITKAMYNRPLSESKYIVSYYDGTPGAIILTRAIYSMLTNADTTRTNHLIDPDTRSTWVEITGRPIPAKATLILHPVNPDNLNFIERMLMPHMDRYRMNSYETSDFTTLQLDGRHWLVIKEYPFLTPRIKEVKIGLD